MMKILKFIIIILQNELKIELIFKLKNLNESNKKLNLNNNIKEKKILFK